MRTRSITQQMAAATLLALPLSAAAAPIIEVEVSQVSGSTWHYDYSVSGVAFNEPPAAPGPHGFTLYFDYSLYGSLSNESTANADWDLLVLQPDSGFFLDGLFDALALSTPAGTAERFGIDFEWLGAGRPSGVQDFEVYYCGDADCSNITDFGTSTTTVAATPLPGSLALIGAGLLALRWQRGRRH